MSIQGTESYNRRYDVKTAAKPMAAEDKDTKGPDYVDKNGTSYKNVIGKIHYSEDRKKIFKEIGAELGVSDKRADWSKLAKTDNRIKIFDKNGNPDKDGSIDPGDIVEVTTQKFGVVRFQAGGDGELNGGDDNILSIGTQTAANNVYSGLSRLSGVSPLEAGTSNTARRLGAVANRQAAGNELFNQNEMNNLLAAIMNMIMTSMNNSKQRQYHPNIEYQYT